MTPLTLAQHLHRANVGPEADWHNLTEDGRQGYLREAEAALAALRGPRTGHELCEQLLIAVRRHGSDMWGWTEAPPAYRAAWEEVAATFATPKPPEGWPDNWESGASGYMYSKDGTARLPSSEAGRLAAWAFSSGAPVQPTSTVDHGAEIERLKTALALARRDEQRAQERMRQALWREAVLIVRHNAW